MKKIVLFLFCVLAAFAAQAQQSQFGAGLDLYLQVDEELADTSSASDTNLSAKAIFIIKLDNALQVEPFFLAGVTSRLDPDNVAPWPAEYSQTYLGGGAALVWFPLRTEPWSFGAAASLSLNFHQRPSNVTGAYSNVDFGLNLPLVIELALTKNIHVRISHPIAGLSYHVEGDRIGATGNQSGTFAFSSFASGFSPSFGFRFYF